MKLFKTIFSALVRPKLPTVFILFTTLTGCIDPYTPTVNPVQINLLVVDGFLDGASGSATVVLSRTRLLTDSSYFNPEFNADVSISSASGGHWTLMKKDSGKYTVSGIPMIPGNEYRLKILTNNNIEYFSDPVTVLSTPPIDSLTGATANDRRGWTISVTTHDPAAKTRYYAWDYISTYEYRAYYKSTYEVINKRLSLRSVPDEVYRCWQSYTSGSIASTSSEQLDQDLISAYPLITLAKGSPQLSVRYSMLVKQRAVSEDEYIYLDKLRKTTQNLGSIFGSTPGPVVGNVHQSSDLSVPVLGYFSAGEIKEKRYFINVEQLPEVLTAIGSDEGCSLDTACLNIVSRGPSHPCSFLYTDLVRTEMLVDPLFLITGELWGFTYSTTNCTDCRLKGGTTDEPSYWE